MPNRPEHRHALLTGATGMVGRRVAVHLLRQGFRVRSFQRATTAAPPGCEVVRGTLEDDQAVRSAVAGCDIVVHCAGEKRDASHMQRVNVEGTRHLIEAARLHGVRVFCHLSSAGVTGFTRDGVITETTPCRPMNLYEQTKLDAEKMVAAAGLPGGRTVILRPTNVFDESIVEKSRMTTRRQRLKLWLKGNEHAHLVYVEDIAAAVLHAITAELPSGEAYLVSSDEEGPFTHAWIANRVNSGSGRTPVIRSACPPMIPWLLRTMRNGRANRGAALYCGRKLAETGFRMPWGVERGLDAAIEAARAVHDDCGRSIWDRNAA